MNEALDDVSDFIFPGSKRLQIWTKDNDFSNSSPLLLYAKKQQEIVSSLPLQVLLYFHWRYSILWIVLQSILIHNKSSIVSQFEKIVTTITFIIWCVIEIFRIYLGYSGNLREQVPHLAGFFFLSIFPQFVLMISFLALPNSNYQTKLEITFIIFQIIFFVFELGFGYIATKHVIRVKTLRFKMERQLKKKTKQFLENQNSNSTSNTRNIDSIKNDSGIYKDSSNEFRNPKTSEKEKNPLIMQMTSTKDLKIDPSDIIN